MLGRVGWGRLGQDKFEEWYDCIVVVKLHWTRKTKMVDGCTNEGMNGGTKEPLNVAKNWDFSKLDTSSDLLSLFLPPALLTDLQVPLNCAQCYTFL